MKKTLLLIFILLISLTSASAVCTVNTAADTNDGACNAENCSLREAVSECSGVINFSLDLVGRTIGLNMGEIVVPHPVNIVGWGADAITVSGNNVGRIFYIPEGVNASISGLTLTGGNGMGTLPNNGGAIRALGGLTLTGVYLTGNSAPGLGAAVSFERTGVTQKLVDSTVAYNNVGPDFFNAAVVGPDPALYNSTICKNTGAGLSTSNLAVVVNSTIAENGPRGVIFYNDALLYMGNSILRDMYAFGAQASVESAGNNIVSRASDGQLFPGLEPSDRVGVDPLLGTLSFNGGRVRTLPLIAGSPAIDAGNNTIAANNGLAADQRGYLRIFDGDGSGTATVDIGAFEFNSTASAAPVSVSGRVLTASGQPVRSISVSITDPQGNARHAFTSSLGWFTFDQMPGNGVYKISISSKRYNAPEKVVFADQNITDADIFVTPAGESKAVR